MSSSLNKLSEIMACIAQPARIQILMAIGTQEACVCHLETVLEMSQASISQHLMILRKIDLVVTRRDGRHIYYGLSNPSLLDVFRKVASINGIDMQSMEKTTFTPIPGCPCPMCMPDIDPKLVCKKNQKIKKNQIPTKEII